MCDGSGLERRTNRESSYTIPTVCTLCTSFLDMVCLIRRVCATVHPGLTWKKPKDASQLRPTRRTEPTNSPPTMVRWSLAFALCFLLQSTGITGFIATATGNTVGLQRRRLLQCKDRKTTAGDDRIEDVNTQTNVDTTIDDLQPGPLQFRRESMLFGTNPATKRNNAVLDLWKGCKATLPRLVTGAKDLTTGNDNPVGAIYNMLLVRFPLFIVGGVYIRNFLQGHPVSFDLLGTGPQELNPLVVIAFLWLILR